MVPSGTSGGLTVWEVSGDQGEQWRYADAHVPDGTIVFEGVRGVGEPDSKSDVALDNVAITCNDVVAGLEVPLHGEVSFNSRFHARGEAAAVAQFTGDKV